MSLSNNPEFIQFAARIEREMDSGETPFVVMDGARYPITPEQVEKFGLVSGQTISQLIMNALIKDLQSIAIDKLMSGILGAKYSDELKDSMEKEFQDSKPEMEEKAAKVEELRRQKELQPSGTEEDTNSKGSSEVFGKVDWPDPKEDEAITSGFVSVEEGPLDTFSERTSENFSSGKSE
jgi:hypothetical protein